MGQGECGTGEAASWPIDASIVSVSAQDKTLFYPYVKALSRRRSMTVVLENPGKKKTAAGWSGSHSIAVPAADTANAR